MPEFKIVSDYKMMGDQPQAVEKLVNGIKAGKKHQTLMGVTQAPVRHLPWPISSSRCRSLHW